MKLQSRVIVLLYSHIKRKTSFYPFLNIKMVISAAKNAREKGSCSKQKRENRDPFRHLGTNTYWNTSTSGLRLQLHTKPYNCFLLHTHTQPLNTHSQKHNKIHFMLINVAVHTHTHTHTALTYITVIDTKQHGPLCAVWTSGRSIERYPSL